MTAPKPDGLLTDEELLDAMLLPSAPYDPYESIGNCTLLTPDEMRTGLRAVESLVRERIDARRCCECNEPIAPNDWDRRTIALRAAEEIQRAHEDGIDDDPESMAFLLSIIAGAIDQDAANLQSEIDRLREIEALWRDMFPFFEWAQSYLDSSRWAGCKLYDGIKAEMLERDAEIDRLRGEVAELREGLRRFRRWEAADNAS